MNKGRISGHKVLARLSLMAAVAFIHIPAVQAQQGNPEIYVDMSVLQGLGSAPTQEQQPIKLKPPVLRPPAATSGSQPRLIAPTQQAPAYVPPAITAPKPVMAAPVLPKPAPATPQIKKAYVSKPPAMPADEVRRAIVSPEAVPLKSAPPPPVIQPAAVLAPITPIATSDPVPVIAEVIPERKPALPAVELPKIVSKPPSATVFPIETKVRKETSDPATSDLSRPVPVRSGIAGNLKDVVPSRPAPDLDPAATTPLPVPVRDLTEEAVADVPTEKKPPEKKTVKEPVLAKAPPVIPGRKPVQEAKVIASAAIAEEKKPDREKAVEKPPVAPANENMVQKASPELVAKLRAREAEKEVQEAKTAEIEIKKQSVDLANPVPPPGPRGKKNMPAVAKPPVESEVLAEQTVKLPANSDPLLDSLLEKDKTSLVATIESMVAAREDGKPLPKDENPKREMGTSIVKSEPLQRPYNVYRPSKGENPATEPAVKTEEKKPEPPVEIKTASLPEAPKEALVTPRPPPPRAQDEQAYVSVPFAEGLTDLDDKITSEIALRVLPILNDNPAWKLQIQAFASPVKDGVSSARKASLARALSVREYLLSKGIESTRMDVRALGAESDRDPMDRVDLIVFDPAKKG